MDPEQNAEFDAPVTPSDTTADTFDLNALVAEFDVSDIEEAAEPAPQAEAAAEPTAEVVTPPTETPADDKTMEKVVAREVALHQREEALKAREAKFSEYETKIADLEKRASSLPHDLVEKLGTSPMSALKAAGHDPDQVVRLYLAEKMQAEGKPVPPELQTAIDKAHTAAELRSLRAEQQRYQQQMAAQQFVAQVESGAQQYVTKGEFKNAPTVASVAKANPGRIYSEIMDEIARDANSPGRDPKVAILTYDEAAARVEARWAEMRKLFSTDLVPGASTPAVTTPAPKTAPKTTSVTTTPKPLTTPKSTQQSEREILDAIVRETQDEFRRAAKPAR